MEILYTPEGMPWVVSPGDIPSFLRNGYRRQPVEVLPDTLPLVDSGNITPPIADQNSGPQIVDVNVATLKGLTSGLGLGTAIARKVTDSRPYATIEDLIAKIPEVDWLAVAGNISY
jgi:hypothetical protein